jgi:hypothetical protein
MLTQAMNYLRWLAATRAERAAILDLLQCSVVRRKRMRVRGVRMPASRPQAAAQRRARSVLGPSGRAAAARCKASDMRFIA